MFYFTFAIQYSLPIPEETFINIQSTINNDWSLRFIQMVHISVSKIIELTIIAINLSSKIINRDER